MTELEKKKIDELIKEFKVEADKLEQEEKSTNNNQLDNGKTKYTVLYEKYKKKIDKINNSCNQDKSPAWLFFDEKRGKKMEFIIET